MPISLEYELGSVLAEIDRALNADLREPLEQIGAHIVAETLINFDQERTPEGEPWEPSQRAAEENGQTLQDHGHLRDSYTYAVSGETLVVGSDMIYAAIHHFGGEIKAKNGGYLKFPMGDQFVQVKSVTIPARPALGITDETETEIREMLIDYYGGRS